LNFKTLLYIFFTLNFFGCGVKAKPLQPPETTIDSYVESFKASDNLKELIEPSKKKK